jgi:hypothetical protein
VSNDNPTTNPVADGLNALFQQHGRGVLLLDPYGGDHLRPAIDALTSRPPQCLRLNDPIFKDDPQSAPLLIELLSTEETHQDLLAQSIARAQEEARNTAGPRGVCAWLFTEVSLQRLQPAMRQRLDARYSKGERIYLRYFDPRVMPRLAELLGLPTDKPTPPYSSLTHLLGPIHTWCHLNREADLQRHDNPQPSNGGFGGYLHFDQTTSAAIDRVEAVNLTARALLQRAIPCKQSDDGMIDTHLRHAKSLGLIQIADWVAYAWRAMHHGTAFTRHPMLHQVIAQAASNGIPFDALVEARLPASSFEIAAPMRQQHER